jgi:hypothetical protein
MAFPNFGIHLKWIERVPAALPDQFDRIMTANDQELTALYRREFTRPIHCSQKEFTASLFVVIQQVLHHPSFERL